MSPDDKRSHQREGFLKKNLWARNQDKVWCLMKIVLMHYFGELWYRPRGTAPPLPPRQQHGVLASITDQHVLQLIKEGFDKDVVERALHLANDNIQLARSILMEFFLSCRSFRSLNLKYIHFLTCIFPCLPSQEIQSSYVTIALQIRLQKAHHCLP